MDLTEIIQPRSEGVNKFAGTETKTQTINPDKGTTEPQEAPDAQQIAAAAGTTEPAPESKPDPRARVFAEKARAERELQKLRAEIKARDAALAEKQRLVQEYEAKRSLAQVDPVRAAKEALGLDVEDINNFVLNNNQHPPETHIKQLRAEIDQIKAQVEAEKKELQAERERAKLEHEKMLVNDLRTNIQSFVKANNEVYEQINVQEAQDLVYDVIVEHAKQTAKQGQAKLLSYKEACDHVEKWLEQRVEASLNTKKFQSRLSQQTKAETKDAPTAGPTLNNQMTTSAQSAQQRALSRDERIKRAMLVGKA